MPQDVETARLRRLSAFVRSPRWQHFDGGMWRRYRRVRAVTQFSEGGLLRGGYADNDGAWHWTAPVSSEEEARQALFALIETFADTREAAVPPPAPMAPIEPEDWSDWVDESFDREDFDLPEERPLDDEDREALAEIDRQVAEDVAELIREGWKLPLPEDFPSLPEKEDPYDGY